jgi:hypothetical protein
MCAWLNNAPRPERVRNHHLAGGVPAYRQTGRGTIRTKLPLLTFCSPLRARKARPVGGELHKNVNSAQKDPYPVKDQLSKRI